MGTNRPLRFHWSLSQVGNTFRRAESVSSMSGLFALPVQIEFCRRAEECGVESVLMAIGCTRPDPMLLSLALGRATHRLGFMIACRPSLVTPAGYVDQLDTVSRVLGGRASINVVCGHTPQELGGYGCFLEHDQRYEQARSFLDACRAVWGSDTDSRAPEIFLGGSSPQASALAALHADCHFRFAEPPENLRPQIEPVLAAGKEVGLLVALVARPTRGEALAGTQELLRRAGEASRAAHQDFERKSDSVAFTSTYELARRNPSGWVTDVLWAGAVPYLGAPAIALVGSAEEVAAEILQYKRIGISQFLFLGWPDLEEMTFFGREILPRVRNGE
jgi:alkanesulfonate monooxygenase